MATYTTKGYIKKLEKLAQLDVKPFYDVTQEIIARQQSRIFDHGKDFNGSVIDTYKPGPIYVSNQLHLTPKKNRPVGKHGETKFKNGKMHKSTYFPGGYAQYKKAISKGNGRVNLWLFGNFRKAFMGAGGTKNITTSNTRIVIFKAIRPSVHNPQGKLDFIFAKYPNAFKFTKGEKGYVLKRFREIFVQQLSK